MSLDHEAIYEAYKSEAKPEAVPEQVTLAGNVALPELSRVIASAEAPVCLILLTINRLVMA